jgi:hypothetical protein
MSARGFFVVRRVVTKVVTQMVTIVRRIGYQ